MLVMIAAHHIMVHGVVWWWHVHVVRLMVPHAALPPDLLLTTLIYHLVLHIIEYFLQMHEHCFILRQGLDQQLTGLNNRHGALLLRLLVADVLNPKYDHFLLCIRKTPDHVVDR